MDHPIKSNRGASAPPLSLEPMIKFFGLVAAASAASLGCTRSGSDSGVPASSTVTTATAASSSSPIPTANPQTSQTSPCPRTGLWATCSVEKRLRDAGFVLRRVADEAPHRPGFSVTPAVYTLAGKRLEVFIYPNESALSADIKNIDTVSASPRGAPNPWPMPPTFLRSGNLAAVFLTDNATQAERLTLALTAGAPQR